MLRMIRNIFFVSLGGFSLCPVFGELNLAKQYDCFLQYNLVEGLPNICLHPQSEIIGHTWVDGVVWDKPLIKKFYLELAKCNDFFVVLDLGAQTGSFSLLAKYFPHSHWYSFEPIHEAAETLKHNLLINDIRNVSVYELAASESPGRATLKMPDINDWGLCTIGANVLRFIPTGEREIQCIDLDNFITANEIEKVHFIKIDTEGWELFILRGAVNLLKRDHPIILMEFNETNMRQCGVLPSEILEFIQNMNYRWERVSEDDILCIPLEI